MAPTDARGAVIEIIEKRRPEDIDDSLSSSTIVPTEVRINGQALLCSSDYPVTVQPHEMKIPGGDVTLVTLTLFARRIEVRAEAAEVDA